MAVKKIKDGFAVMHCHGAKKGKVIKKFKTKAAADKMHRAISKKK